MFTKHKNIKLFSWEEGLLEIRLNQPKGCQLHLTENVLQDILLNHQNNYLFSLHQKSIIRNTNYKVQVFHKTLKELMQVKLIF